MAACAAGTTLAYPVATVAAGSCEIRELADLIGQYDPGVVYVGLPLSLAGKHAAAAGEVTAKAQALASAVPGVAIRLVDERMSTVSASRSLGAAGRRAKQQRAVIDQAAAVEILQRAMDSEVRQGGPVGVLVKEES